MVLLKKTQSTIFSVHERADVGLDKQTPVTVGIDQGHVKINLAGKIELVLIEILFGPTQGG